jgi:hypothetical protein
VDQGQGEPMNDDINDMGRGGQCLWTLIYENRMAKHARIFQILQIRGPSASIGKNDLRKPR